MVLIIPKLAMSFMPDSNEDKSMLIDIKMPRETSIESMNIKTKEIEALIKEQKDGGGAPLFTYTESMVGYNFGSTEKVPYHASIFTAVGEKTDAKQAMNDIKKEDRI